MRAINCAASSKHRSMRLARMWNNKSPGVATAWRPPARNSRKGCSSAGRGDPKSRSHASDPNPITQESWPSKSRNSTARSSPERSAQNERRVARFSTPGLRVTTRKIAARVSEAATGCARAGKLATGWGALLGSGSIGCGSRGVRGISHAFLLILWSGGISYVRPFFPPRARKDRVPRGPRSWRNGRVGFRLLVYTISKNALSENITLKARADALRGFLQHLHLPPEPHSLALFFARRQQGLRLRLAQLHILSTQEPGNPMQPVFQRIDEGHPLRARRHGMDQRHRDHTLRQAARIRGEGQRMFGAHRAG